MKVLFPLISLFLIFSCKKESSGKSIDNPKDSLAEAVKKDSLKVNSQLLGIEGIKKEYAYLNNQLNEKKLDSLSFDYDCNNERSGKVTFYSDRQGLRIIKHDYAEYSHFSAIENYFIKNNQVFFIFNKETSWNFDGGTPEKPETKDDITEQRIYLQNGQTLKCLEKEYTVRSKDSALPDPDKIPGRETKCNVDKLMETYQLLLKNKGTRGKIKCM